MHAIHIYRVRISLLMIVVALLLAACGGVQGDQPPGKLRVETRTLVRGAVQSVRGVVNFGAGDLTVRGGAGKLMQATFTYDVPTWKPIVTYSTTDAIGRLDLRQPSTSSGSSRSSRNEWDVQLNGHVPLELSIATGAGNTRLLLGALSLTSLSVEAGAGNLIVDLAGNSIRHLNATIRGGAGNTDIVVPHDVGVRVTVSHGLGTVTADGMMQSGNTYENDRAATAGPQVWVDVYHGIGNLTLSVE